MQQPSARKSQFGYAIAAGVIAGVLGFGSGALMSSLAPRDTFSWPSLAIIPLWFLLEIFFESAVAVLGSRSKSTRIASTVALLGGFYVAWFSLHGVVP
jgi:hypothetical protein